MSTTLEALMAQIDALVTEAMFLHQWTAKGVPSASSAKAYQASHAALQSALSEALALTRCACGDSFTADAPGKCVNCRAADGEALSDKVQPAEPVAIYQLQCADGRWIDQTRESYDYNVKHSASTVRVVYAAPPIEQAAPMHRPHATDIYDFAGWLTTRPGVMEVGTSKEAGPMAEAVGEYLRTFPERFFSPPVAPAAPVAPQVVRPMTNERASYFMERFLHEEKLLGPNEQAALHYVIAMLAAASQRNANEA